MIRVHRIFDSGLHQVALDVAGVWAVTTITCHNEQLARDLYKQILLSSDVTDGGEWDTSGGGYKQIV